MQIIVDKPPIYARAAEVFPLEGREIFAWGDKIYNPGGFTIPDWLIAHEEVHEKQQAEAGGPEAWWEIYLVDDEFRFNMELDAHLMEFKVYCQGNKDRNKQAMYRRIVARKLAAPLYGSMITVQDALRRLK